MSGPNEDQAGQQQPDFAAQREAMVQSQVVDRGIRDEAVLRALRTVPREAFVPAGWQESAYDDQALPIPCGQTISQPFTVAFMCEALQLQESDKVLEIGTGSGYGAAVLGQLAGEVHTVERIAELADQARRRLQSLGYDHVHVHVSDGTIGLVDQGPYDAIVVTAGGKRLPPPLQEQLREGGRIVIPLGDQRRGQQMYRFTLRRGQLQQEPLGRFAFVPLVGQFGWQEDD